MSLKETIYLWQKSARVLLCKISSPGSKVSYKVDDRITVRIRYLLQCFCGAMDVNTSPNFAPAPHVKGMKVLNKEAFATKVSIPGIKVPKLEISSSQKTWKPLLFKMRGVKPIGELGDRDPQKDTHSLVLLDPEKLKADCLTVARKEALQSFGLDFSDVKTYEIELHYDNWSSSDIFRAVLPSDADNVTSFTQIGHIAHLNLKPETEPYKFLIGEVLLDKVSSVKTVVNKLGTIDNTYRNFQMELLAGEENYVTQTKEHNCTFELDFSKVYWNSRLATEHQRIVEEIEKNSTVYDVFAGIGPFSVPLAKKKNCTVYANDLNPHSFEYLNKNMKLNKVNLNRVKTFNLDGRDFIQTIVKQDLVKQIEEQYKLDSSKTSGTCDVGAAELELESSDQITTAVKPPSYVVMNLPAIALDFLSEFNGLLKDLPSHLKLTELIEKVLPVVFCYTFSPKTDIETELRVRTESSIGQPLPLTFKSRIVRNVAPNKEMVCVCFKLWPSLVLGEQQLKSDEIGDSKSEYEPESKKQKII